MLKNKLNVRNIKTYVISLFLTIFFVWLLLAQININDIFAALSNITFFTLSAAFLIYIISNIFRALRFKFLIQKKITLFNMFKIVCVHNLALGLVPGRLGELSYIYLIKNKKVKGGANLGSLLLARVFDMLALSFYFIMALFFIKEKSSIIQYALTGVGIFLVAVSISFLVLLFYEAPFLKTLKFILKTLKLTDFHIGLFILKKFAELMKFLRVIRSKKNISIIMLYSLIIWGANYLFSYLIVTNLGMKIGFPLFMVAATLSVFSYSIPISGIAGLGTYEGLWALFFLSVGISKEMAIVTGFGSHLIILTFSLLMGLFGLYFLNKSNFT